MGQQRKKVIEVALEPEKLKKLEELEKAPVAVTEAKKEKTRPPKIRGKRYKELISLLNRTKEYSISEAAELVVKTSNTGFDSTIEAHINLNLSPERTDHQIRVVATLPHPLGKRPKILIFTDKNKEELKKLGVEIGTETTLRQIETGKLEWDKIIAHPSWMPALAKVAKVLGPKSLMPNPKSGTVTDDPLKSVKDFSKGMMELRTEKLPIIHVVIGKASFNQKQIEENFLALVDAINAAKPGNIKNELIKSIYLSSTMGPSVKVDLRSLTGPDPVRS